MGRLLDIIRQSLSTLWAHKLRSFLTMFGIAWGVGSLLLLVGLGEGFRSGQQKNLANLGQDIMFLFNGRVPPAEGTVGVGRLWRITYGDYLAIKEEAKSIRNVAPVLNRQDIRASSEFNSANGEVFGTTPSYNQIRTVPVDTGRWMTEQDEAENRRVAVVGYELRRTLFPGRPAVGSIILLNGARFEVIGVTERLGRGDHNGTNNRIFIPISTMRGLFPLKGKARKTRYRSSTISPRSVMTTRVPAMRYIALLLAAMASTRSWKALSRTGTRSRTRSAWAGFSTPWIGFWAEWAW